MIIKKKKVLIAAAAILSAAAMAVGGFAIYGNYQMSKIPGMSFRECLEFTTSGNRVAVITVGTIKQGEASWTVYGENGEILPKELHTYEIGSLTKTFTAALVSRAVREGIISLDAGIDEYLELPEKGHYPSIRSILTHTSGYSSYYLESPMIGNFFSGRNSFCGIGDSMILDRLAKTDISDTEHGFDYSNFGYAALGLMLEKVYQTEFTTLMNSYLDELGLDNSHISDGSGDLGNYWGWTPGDTYMSAGAITSDIEDMLLYMRLQLDGGEFTECQESLRSIDASSDSYKSMGINMDEIGMAWIIDRENGIIWHNGGTGHYNSYSAFSQEKDCAVVILSNLPPDYRIPATVMGVKLIREISGE